MSVSRPTATPPPGFRAELLTLAWQAASAIPLEPHVRDRSKAQEGVILASLEAASSHDAASAPLGLDPRLSEWIEDVAGWRRGGCLVALARSLAERGETEAARSRLEAAERVASEQPSDDWRRARILDAVHDARRSTTFAGVESSGADGATEAAPSPTPSFEEELAALDAMVASQNFDSMLAALRVHAARFGESYASSTDASSSSAASIDADGIAGGDIERRAIHEARIREGCTTMPPATRFDLLLSLAKSATEHSDFEKARALLDEAARFPVEFEWPPEMRIPMLARIATLRSRAGDAEAARADADAALASYSDHEAAIVDIHRAGALRSIAEAFAAMGDRPAAHAAYARAAEAGALNPNARPRAEDLAATCASMASAGVEPDVTLRDRLHAILAGLVAPW